MGRRTRSQAASDRFIEGILCASLGGSAALAALALYVIGRALVMLVMRIA